MSLLILFFAGLILLAGIAIILNPVYLLGPLNKHSDNLMLHILAVVIRLLLGVILIRQADVSSFPLTIEILGWLSLTAALSFVLIGRNNFKRLMAWAFSLLKPYGRIAGFVAVAFGAFLIYAFV